MSAVDTGGPAGRVLWYLCLELPQEGQAAHTHVFGTLHGLAARGWTTRLWSPRPRRGRRGAIRRLMDSVLVQAGMIFQRKRPDVLYVRGHFASVPALLWARLRRVPVVWELNGAGTDVLSSWPQARRILPLLDASVDLQMRLCSTAIGVTPILAEWALEHGARSSHVVGNGADTDLFSPTATTSQILPKTYVNFTGTLAKWQGLDSLFAAMDDPGWPKGVDLVVVGDGVMTGFVAERADADPRVTYLGRLPHGEVGGVVAGSLAALSPMWAADRVLIGVVPLKLFEAMACGVPVIVTDLPGQADIVTTSDCGIVVPPNDPKAIAAAVTRLATDPALARALGERARSAAIERYSWDAAAGRTHAIIVDLLGG